MRLEYNCSSCRKLNYYKSDEPTRGDLQMKVGDEVNVTCKHCNSVEKIHINKISAIVDFRIILISILLGCLATIIVWNLYGAIGTISFLIPILMWVNENRAKTNFNKYMVRRK